jgi:hypothetical protein
VCFGTLALAIASAASSYSVTLFQPSVVGDKELKPGDYRIEVDGDKAIIKSGKQSIEAPVKTETGDKKFPQTTVRYSNADGRYHVAEIRLGGTKTTLVFNN